MRTGNRFGIVEDGGDTYVVETRYGGGPGFGMLYILPAMWLSHIMYGLYLAKTAVTYIDSRPRRVLGCTAYGLILLGWPALVVLSGEPMWALVSPLIAIGGLVGTWCWYSYRLWWRDSEET
ncbi:hypothetical protein JCM18750_28450 [Halostagnicola bangensis]